MALLGDEGLRSEDDVCPEKRVNGAGHGLAGQESSRREGSRTDVSGKSRRSDTQKEGGKDSWGRSRTVQTYDHRPR